MHVCFGPDPDMEHCSAETSNEKLLTLNCSQFQERFRLLVYLSVHYFLSMPGNIGKAVALFRFSQTTLEMEVIFYIAPIPFKVASARIYSSLLSRHASFKKRLHPKCHLSFYPCYTYVTHGFKINRSYLNAWGCIVAGIKCYEVKILRYII